MTSTALEPDGTGGSAYSRDRLGDRQDTGLLEEQLHRCRSNVYPKGGAPACSIPTGKTLAEGLVDGMNRCHSRLHVTRKTFYAAASEFYLCHNQHRAQLHAATAPLQNVAGHEN